MGPAGSGYPVVPIGSDFISVCLKEDGNPGEDIASGKDGFHGRGGLIL